MNPINYFFFYEECLLIYGGYHQITIPIQHRCLTKTNCCPGIDQWCKLVMQCNVVEQTELRFSNSWVLSTIPKLRLKKVVSSLVLVLLIKKQEQKFTSLSYKGSKVKVYIKTFNFCIVLEACKASDVWHSYLASLAQAYNNCFKGSKRNKTVYGQLH